MDKKYELTDLSIEGVGGTILYRIRSLMDFGGVVAGLPTLELVDML